MATQAVQPTKSNASKASKGKKVMNPSVTETSNPTVYSGTGNKKVTNPFTGQEILREGKFTLPLATNWEQALEMVGGNEQDLIFWFNHGRKIQARFQLNSTLDPDLGEDYKSFQNAMDELVTEKTSPERRKKIQEFILAEEKFDGLRARMEEIQANGFGPINLDFSKDELVKPSGIRGRKPKSDKSDDSGESEE